MTSVPSDSPKIDELLAHRPWVRVVARRLARDDFAADDLEQDAWLAALRAPPTPGPTLSGWFDSVVRNRRRQEHRGAMRLAARERGAARPEATASAAGLVAEADAHRRVVNAVLDLPEPYRAAILLRYFEGLPPREVAARAGVPVETVRSRLRRAADLLRTELSADGDPTSWLGAVGPLLVGGSMKASPKIGLMLAIGLGLLGAASIVFLLGGVGEKRREPEATSASAAAPPVRIRVEESVAAPATSSAELPKSEAPPTPAAAAPPATKSPARLIEEPTRPDVAVAPATEVEPATTSSSKLDPELPSYQVVQEQLSGTLNAVGSDTMINIVTNWGEAFGKHYPNVKVQVEGKGSSTAPPALIAGAAQLGPMSREMKDTEINGFEAKYGYKPTRMKTCLDALGVFVHKDNPLESLTLKQLDSIFSNTRKLGGDEIATWGQLGLGGEWADAPITLYGRNSASGTYTYFKEKVMDKGDFRDNVKEQPGSSGVVDGISQDRFGIGYSGIGYQTSGVKVLNLLKKEGGTVYAPTLGNVMSEAYPLGRFLNVYINKSTSEPLSPVVREFFRFVYSRQGQEIVVKEGFLPFSAKIAAPERAKVQ